MRLTKAEKVYQVIAYSIIGLLAILSLYPLVHIVMLSLTSEPEWVAKKGMILWVSNPTLEAYRQVLTRNSIIVSSFVVSVLRTVIGTVSQIFFTMILGYILSRKRLPFRNTIMTLVLITILFNGGLIPTYLTVKDTGLYDSFWAMIVPGLVDSWSVLVFKQFFEGIPEEIEESADIDGADEFRKMWQIVVPMSVSVIVALSMFAALGHWNSWFDASIYIVKDELKPLQLILKNMFDSASTGFDASSSVMQLDTDRKVATVSLRMAVAVVGTVPILSVYPFAQKYFTEGVYVGSVKG